MLDFDNNKLKKFFSAKNLYIIFYILIFLFCCYVRIDLYLFANDFHIDEAKLTFNLEQCSYTELFKPLEYYQVAPYIFLVLVKFTYNLLSPFSTNITYQDLVYRIIPLLSGIVVVPCFAYILNKLFKNRIVTLLGMLLLAFNPTSIVYSTICKQYSFEELITVIIIALFLKIDFKKEFIHNYIIFICLGFLLFGSMTALFILPGGFLYLILKSENIKIYLKQFICCLGIFALIFATYVFNFLLPIYNTYFTSMANGNYVQLYNFTFYEYFYALCQLIFRTKDFAILLSIILIFSFILSFLKKIRTTMLYASPIIITLCFCYFKFYPLKERFLVFLIPCCLILILYPLTLIPKKLIYKNKITYILLFITPFIGLKYYDKNYINGMQFNSKILWNYFLENYKYDGKVITCPMDSALIYYNSKTLNLDMYNCYAFSSNLPPGKYYLISSRIYKAKKSMMRNFLRKDYKVLNWKNFKGRIIYNNIPLDHKKSTKIPTAVYIKFEKLK